MNTKNSSPSHKKQEEKFVEWSREASPKDYDISRIIGRLSELPQANIRILDVGGGIGTVGAAIVGALANISVDVVDNSILAKEHFVSCPGVQLIPGDFLTLDLQKKYDVVIFRTVLHHLVGKNSTETLCLQHEAIAKAATVLDPQGLVFVVENFYESLLIDDLTGEIIFQLTSWKRFATLFRRLGANTAGEGVRFRSFRRWLSIFSEHAFELAGDVAKDQWKMPYWQRVPFLCRDRYQALLVLRKKQSPKILS